MTRPTLEAHGSDARSLAASLVPVVEQACEGRLSEITWFKADWQRGGAATGFARFDDGTTDGCAVVVKLPVVPRELIWTRRLQVAARSAKPRSVPSPDPLMLALPAKLATLSRRNAR